MINWPLLRFPPINLFSIPVQGKICRHTHWLVLHSFNQRWCYDCDVKQSIVSVMPKHQR